MILTDKSIGSMQISDVKSRVGVVFDTFKDRSELINDSDTAGSLKVSAETLQNVFGHSVLLIKWS